MQPIKESFWRVFGEFRLLESIIHVSVSHLLKSILFLDILITFLNSLLCIWQDKRFRWVSIYLVAFIILILKWAHFPFKFLQLPIYDQFLSHLLHGLTWNLVSTILYIPIPQIFDILIFWHYMSIWRSNFCLIWSWLKFSLPNAAKEWFCKLFADDCKIFGAVDDGWRIKSRSIRFFKPGRMVEDLATTLHCKKCNPRTQERTLSTTKIWNPLLQKRI